VGRPSGKFHLTQQSGTPFKNDVSYYILVKNITYLRFDASLGLANFRPIAENATISATSMKTSYVIQMCDDRFEDSQYFSSEINDLSVCSLLNSTSAQYGLEQLK